MPAVGPFLAFVPFYTPAFRLATIVIFWGFHAGLAATMNIGLFPLFSMVAWLPFIPTQAWRSRGGVRTPPDTADWRSRLSSMAALILLAYILVLLAERARVIPRVLPARLIAVGTALRIQQTWNMFAPDPSTVTVQHEIRKTLRDGSHVTERAATSFRWRVYLTRAGVPRAADHSLMHSLRRFTVAHCGRTDRADGIQPVERVAMVMHHWNIHDDGLGEPTTVTLIDARCPTQSAAVGDGELRPIRDLP